MQANASNVCVVYRCVIRFRMHIWDVSGTGARTTVGVSGNRDIKTADCALCGQCITHCPTGALRERDDTEKLYRALEDKDTIVVAPDRACSSYCMG